MINIAGFSGGRHLVRTMSRLDPDLPQSDFPGIDIVEASKSFSSKLVLSGVSLTARRREFVAVLGPSGCGKTTLLRLIAGFERLDSGTIGINGHRVSGPGRHVAPERRNIGIVFQSFALWPHMTVAENVGYSLKVAGVPRAERDARIADAVAKVNLAGLEERRPATLSGGQRQRVALARCLVAHPSVVLLDEPLANLDVHLRAAMEEEFRRFHANAGATTLYVTHDQAEAMALADRVAVMQEGRLVQFAEPEVLYSEPADEFVARFIGEGRILDVEDVRPGGDGHASATLLGRRLRLRAAAGERQRSRARACVRPGGLRLAAAGERGVDGVVERSVYRGGYWQVEVRLAGALGAAVVVNANGRHDRAGGTSVCVCVDDGWIIPESKDAAGGRQRRAPNADPGGPADPNSKEESQ